MNNAVEGIALQSTLRLAPIFSDHMVLCRDRNVRIFGKAHSGDTVTVSIHDHIVSAAAVKGNFEIILPPVPSGGPYTMTVTDCKSILTFSDILIGDVYFAGGQSNMEMQLVQTANGDAYAAQADYPSIRYCNYPVQSFLDEETLTKERNTFWRAVAPGACGDISALAFHFAVNLQSELKVPIGIIDCYLGGTSITSWLDETALSAVTGGKSYLDDYRERNKNKTDAQYDAEFAAQQTAHAAWSAKADAMKAKNPSVTWNDFIAALGPCPWPPPEGRKAAYRPCGLIETMVKRIAPYTITGFLYYQGESDYMRPQLYRAMLMALIASWRDLFVDPDLPFLNVQLPMFEQRDDLSRTSWALIRQAQEQVYHDMRNTGLAVMIDGGEENDIHPQDKVTVAKRLCLQALYVVYHRDVVCESPRALNVRAESGSLIVQVSSALQNEKSPRLFELAGEDEVYYPSHAEIAGTVIRVSSADVPQPRFVRYAWVNYGKVNVFGTNGLPLAPFCLR